MANLGSIWTETILMPNPLTKNRPWASLRAKFILVVGSAVGSGVLMTLGVVVAPSAGRAEFRGAWRVSLDLGNAVVTFLLSAGAALGSLAAGVWAFVAVSVGTCTALARWVPLARAAWTGPARLPQSKSWRFWAGWRFRSALARPRGTAWAWALTGSTLACVPVWRAHAGAASSVPAIWQPGWKRLA